MSKTENGEIITAPKATNDPCSEEKAKLSDSLKHRAIQFSGFLVLLMATYGLEIKRLIHLSLESDLHSHVVLVPIVTAYLLYNRWGQLPVDFTAAPKTVWFFAVLAFLALSVGQILPAFEVAVSDNDQLAISIFSLLSWLISGLAFFFGGKWLTAATFPVAFLIFAVPLPDGAAVLLEVVLQHASAYAASILFEVTGMPVYRDGLVFNLPGISLKVAQECSGIRSSWVLLITTILASSMFLRRPVSRALLTSFVFPIAVIRNAIRIVSIGALCVYQGPDMVDGVIHRKGGPLFFVLSLLPLAMLIWGLRRSEKRKASVD